MSRRKAGSAPRRVDPAPAANPDNEMEMSDLVIDVKLEPDARVLQAPKEVSALGRFGGEPRHSPGPVPAGAALHALGAQNPWALCMPLTSSLAGELPRPSPLPLGPAFPPWDPWGGPLLWVWAPEPALGPSPGPGPSLPTSDLKASSLFLETPWPHPTLTAASSLQTASPGPTNTQIC